MRGATQKHLPYHLEIISTDNDDATAINGQELKRVRLVCGFREGGVAYSLSPVYYSETSQLCELMHIGRG